MKLFVDNCISPYLARAINVVVEREGHAVVALRDKFRQDVSDVDWISALGSEGGWTVLSDDHRIRKVPAERAAWRAAKLKGFFLAKGWRNMPIIEKTGLILLWWTRIVEMDRSISEGIIEIPAGRSGRFRLIPL